MVDAFSSDAIPTHLLTLEALSVYRSKLAKSGVIAWHLSNRYLDLEPVLARFVRETGVAGLIRSDTDRPPGLDFNGYPTVWAALASNSEQLSPLQNTAGWRSLRIQDSVGVWTDDFSNIFSVFLWAATQMTCTILIRRIRIRSIIVKPHPAKLALCHEPGLSQDI